MTSEMQKPKFIWKDALYLAVLAISLGVTIAKFSERVTLLEATVQRHEDERKLYNVAVISSDIGNIKDDISEIKGLLKDMQ